MMVDGELGAAAAVAAACASALDPTPAAAVRALVARVPAASVKLTQRDQLRGAASRWLRAEGEVPADLGHGRAVGLALVIALLCVAYMVFVQRQSKAQMVRAAAARPPRVVVGVVGVCVRRLCVRLRVVWHGFLTPTAL